MAMPAMPLILWAFAGLAAHATPLAEFAPDPLLVQRKLRAFATRTAPMDYRRTADATFCDAEGLEGVADKEECEIACGALSADKIAGPYSTVSLPNGCLIEAHWNADYSATGKYGKDCYWNSEPTTKDISEYSAMKSSYWPRLVCRVPPCDSATCAIYADPHVSTFDNFDDAGPSALSMASIVNKRSSTFSGRPLDLMVDKTGLFWLVRSDSLHIQGMFFASGDFQPDNAALGSIFVGGPFIQEGILIVEALNGNIFWQPSPRVGGVVKANESYSDETISIEQEKRGDAFASVQVSLPQGLKLAISRLARHIDAKIEMRGTSKDVVDGLCGDNNGESEDDAVDDERMASLRVQHHEALNVRAL